MNIYSTKFDKIKPNKLTKLSPLLDLNLLSDDVWLGGGSLRSLVDPNDEVADFDLFFRRLSAVEEVQKKLEQARYNLIYSCPNKTLFTYSKDSNKVQVVCREEYLSMPQMLETFDFTACIAATNGKQLYFSTNFVKDVRKKELRLASLTYPTATLKRIVKYSNKGYKIGRIAREFVENVNSNTFSADDLEGYVD